MIDPVAASSLALTSHSPTAIGLTFLAGAVTSVGPCVAPRYIAIAAIANGQRRPMVPTLFFVGGLLGAFMVLGFGAGLLGSLSRCSTLLYAVLALGLIVGGCVTLARAAPHRCAAHGCAATRRCETSNPAERQRSLGAIFMLGATSALIVSPCCTPVVAAIVASATAIGKPIAGLILLTSFALGHALPLFFAGSVASIVRRTVRWHVADQAPAIVAGVLMITLGAYYGVLA